MASAATGQGGAPGIQANGNAQKGVFSEGSPSESLYKEWAPSGGVDACVFCSWTLSEYSLEEDTEEKGGEPPRKRAKTREEGLFNQSNTNKKDLKPAFNTNLVLARPNALEIYKLRPRGTGGEGDPNLTEAVCYTHYAKS